MLFQTYNILQYIATPCQTVYFIFKKQKQTNHKSKNKPQESFKSNCIDVLKTLEDPSNNPNNGIK